MQAQPASHNITFALNREWSDRLNNGISKSDQAVIDDEIENMLRGGVIEPATNESVELPGCDQEEKREKSILYWFPGSTKLSNPTLTACRR